MKKILFLIILCFYFSFEANAAKTIRIYHFLTNNRESVYEDENIVLRFITADYGWEEVVYNYVCLIRLIKYYIKIRQIRFLTIMEYLPDYLLMPHIHQE